MEVKMNGNKCIAFYILQAPIVAKMERLMLLSLYDASGLYSPTSATVNEMDNAMFFTLPL